MVMIGLVIACLYHPGQTIFDFPVLIYSSEMERYEMTNGSGPLVFCLYKSCGRFEPSYTVVCGFVTILPHTGSDY